MGVRFLDLLSLLDRKMHQHHLRRAGIQNRGQIVTASKQAEEGDECIHGVIDEGDGPDAEKKEEEIVELFGQLWSIPNPIPKSS